MQATPRYLIGSAFGVGSEMPSQLMRAPRHSRIIPYLYGLCVRESSIVMAARTEENEVLEELVTLELDRAALKVDRVWKTANNSLSANFSWFFSTTNPKISSSNYRQSSVRLTRTDSIHLTLNECERNWRVSGAISRQTSSRTCVLLIERPS